MLMCVSSERENEIIYIFFRKLKLYYYKKKREKMTVANEESHTTEMIRLELTSALTALFTGFFSQFQNKDKKSNSNK